jgi:hypothetical protein
MGSRNFGRSGRARWRRSTSASSQRNFIAAGDDKVIVPSRMVAHGTGSEIALSAAVTWVWTIDEHRLATKVEAFESRAAALKAARGIRA